MSVYVDNPRMPYGRMLMCHMLADTDDELHAMAAKIGVARRWHQGDHYDVCAAKRAIAIKFGALAVSTRELVRIRRAAIDAALADEEPPAGRDERQYSDKDSSTTTPASLTARGKLDR